MDDFDHADLDGDGEFDAIDIDILENGDNQGGAPGSGSGCMVIFAVAAGLAAGIYGAVKLI